MIINILLLIFLNKMKLISKIYISNLFISIIIIIIFLTFGWKELEENGNNFSWSETSYSDWIKQDSNILYNTNITSINMNYKNNKNILNYFKGYYNDNINIKLLPFYSIFNKYAVFYANNENNNINIVSQYEVLFYKKNTLNILDYPNKKKIVNKIVKQSNNIYNIYNKDNNIIAITYINNINKKYIIYDSNNNNNQINITISNNNLKIDYNNEFNEFNEFISLRAVLGVISYSLLDTMDTYSINILAKTMFYVIVFLIIISFVLFIIKKKQDIKYNARVCACVNANANARVNIDNSNVCQV